jgi:hypothetical protein
MFSSKGGPGSSLSGRRVAATVHARRRGEGTGPVAGPVFKTALSRLARDGRFDSFPSPPKPQTDAANYSEIRIARYRVRIVVEELGRYDCWTLVGGDARSATFRPRRCRLVARGRRTGARRGGYVSRTLGFRAAAHTVGCIRRNRLSGRSSSRHRPSRRGSKSGWEVPGCELRQEGTGWLLHNRYYHIFGSPSHSIC